MHLLNMFSLKTINKIVQSGNITHPLALQTKPFFEYSICRVDIDNMLTFPVAIFVYKLYL